MQLQHCARWSPRSQKSQTRRGMLVHALAICCLALNLAASANVWCARDGKHNSDGFSRKTGGAIGYRQLRSPGFALPNRRKAMQAQRREAQRKTRGSSAEHRFFQVSTSLPSLQRSGAESQGQRRWQTQRDISWRLRPDSQGQSSLLSAPRSKRPLSRSGKLTVAGKSFLKPARSFFRSFCCKFPGGQDR